MTDTSHISSTLMMLEFAVLLAVFLSCVKLKGLHPIVFIAVSAVVGIVFSF